MSTWTKIESVVPIVILAAGLHLALRPMPGADSVEPSASAFTHLAENQSMVVEFESTGCFHHSVERFVIRGDQPNTVHIENPETHEEEDRAELDGSARADLERSLAYYRSHPPGSCTTVDTVIVSLWQDGRQLSHESLVDGSCATLLGDAPPSISEIVNRQRAAF